jgi:type IV secretory pathway ATPase VirB11/archaellum biosynthesis ATPase
MTIRKFRSKPVTISDLLNFDTYSSEALAFLSLIFQSDYSVIIAGNTASGKTSTLNAMFTYIPLNERILIIEETPEINIPHKHVIKMLSNPGLGIDMRSLVEDTLRMRPDRVIVGEVRTPEEVSALVETILSGQARGSYATFHAQSSEEVIKRMVSLGVMPIDAASIDFIIVQRRMLRYDTKTRKCWEERRGFEISEVIQEDGQPKLNNIFNFNIKNGQMVGSPSKAKKIDEIADNFSVSKRELFDEIDRRKKLIEKISKKDITFTDSVYEIQNALFKLNDNEIEKKETVV